MRVLVVILSCFLVASAGYGRDEGTGSSSGIPNPSAALCHELGGHYLLTGSACEIEGAYIEGWNLFATVRSGVRSTAVEAFLAHPAVTDSDLVSRTPAAHYCERVGGSHVIEAPETVYEEPLPMCVFPDSSAIGAETLFAGPEAFPALARILVNRGE